MLNSLKNFLKDLPSGFEVKEELRFTCPWGVVYSLLHPRALSKKCPLIFNSFFMVSSMAFINWNSVLEGMKPVFCLIILAVCIADSHFILECGIHYIGGFQVAQGLKKSTCQSGDMGSIPGSGRSLGEGNGNSSILAWKNPTDRGAWQIVHGVAKGLDTT